MNKTFNFVGLALKTHFGITMDIEILQTTEQNAYIEFESDSDKLVIDHTENSLTISHKENENTSSDLSNVNSFGDLCVFLFKKGLSSYSVSGVAKIFIPKDKNSSLKLKANNANIKSCAMIDNFKIDINNGEALIKNNINNLNIESNNCNFKIKGEVKNLEIDSNNGDIKIKGNVENLDIKSNNSDIKLTANNKIHSWQIKTNNGDVKINKKDFDGNIYYKGKIINSGSGLGTIKVNGRNPIEIK